MFHAILGTYLYWKIVIYLEFKFSSVSCVLFDKCLQGHVLCKDLFLHGSNVVIPGSLKGEYSWIQSQIDNLFLNSINYLNPYRVLI